MEDEQKEQASGITPPPSDVPPDREETPQKPLNVKLNIN